MAVEPYDWQRDQGLDFPDDEPNEPTQDEINERIRYYETHPLDSHSGMRDA